MMALKMLLVTVALSDISFVLGVMGETVLAWLGRATQQASPEGKARIGVRMDASG